MKNETSRRAVIGAIAALPAAGLVAAVPATALASANGAKWYALKADYLAAVEARDAYDRKIMRPAEDAYRAECRQPPKLLMKVGSPENGGTIEMSGAYIMTSDAPQAVPGTILAAETLRLRKLVEEHDAECAAIHEKHRISEMEERYEVLWTRARDLEKRLMAAPSPDYAALGFKIETQFGDGQMDQESSDSIDMDLLRPIVEDARRLLSEGRA